MKLETNNFRIPVYTEFYHPKQLENLEIYYDIRITNLLTGSYFRASRIETWTLKYAKL